VTDLFKARSVALVCCTLAVATVGRGENPEQATTCQLTKDPAAYNHRLLKMTGFITHGFEDFSLFDPACSSVDSNPVWIEYGGRRSSPTVYCCGAAPSARRPEALVVEDIPTPVIEDERFREFDRLIRRHPDTVARATIVGRFFAGNREPLPNGNVLPGYGHLGCCYLLVLQQVLSVDPQNRPDLDYRASPDSPKTPKEGCGYKDLVPIGSSAEFVAAQEQAESGHREWAFTDPARVATNTLAQFLGISPATITGVTHTPMKNGRVQYEWRPTGKREEYLVVASRPYWLSFYATNSQRVAWVIIAAYESFCN
jgi:hypothetical protein